MRQRVSPGLSAPVIWWRQIWLRRAPQSNDRQVGMSSDMLNFHVEPGAWFAGNQRVRQRAWRATRPDRPWFEPGTTIRGESLEVDLVRRFAPEGAVGSVLIVPVEHDDQLRAHGFTPRGNHDPLHRFLDRAHGSFQNGNTAMFPQGAETRPDSTVATPVLVPRSGKELAALVADQVSRRGPCGADGSAETE